MEIPTPAELREKRIRMGLKQADVARMAGISQSMVARIESGSVDPRVSTLARIVEVLQAAERSAITAADVMTSPVFSVAPDEPVNRAVEIMGQNSISQLPVLEKGVPVGCISESAIMNAMEEGGFHQTHQKLVRDCMEPGFPTVPPYDCPSPASQPCGPGTREGEGAWCHHQTRPDIAASVRPLDQRDKVPEDRCGVVGFDNA